MGTSQSGLGSPSRVPLTPPWVPDPVLPPGQDDEEQDDQDAQPIHPAPVDLAPIGRFRSARASFGRFANSGSPNDLRRGVGHYVRKGLGGRDSAVRRFGGTTRTAGTLYRVLSTAGTGQTAEYGNHLDPVLVAGRSVDEVIDAVVDAVRPVDGTQDAEASRNAVRNALSDVLERFPDADFLNLSEDQRLFAIERYLALDVYNRMRLDVGKHIKDKAPGVATALSRMRQIRDYVRETISAMFRKLRTTRESISARRISQMGVQALREAFEVFEDYVR